MLRMNMRAWAVRDGASKPDAMACTDDVSQLGLQHLSGETTMTRRAMVSLLCLGIVALGGCGAASKPSSDMDQSTQEPNEQTGESSNEAGAEEEQIPLDANAVIIKTATGYDDDCCAGASETLEELEIGDLESVTLVPEYSYTYKATTFDGQDYYLEFGEYGYLEVVRSDALDGEVLWAVID